MKEPLMPADKGASGNGVARCVPTAGASSKTQKPLATMAGVWLLYSEEIRLIEATCHAENISKRELKALFQCPAALHHALQVVRAMHEAPE